MANVFRISINELTGNIQNILRERTTPIAPDSFLFEDRREGERELRSALEEALRQTRIDVIKQGVNAV